MVVRRVGMYKSRMKDTIAPAVLEIIMSKNVDQALHDAGFSVSRVSSAAAIICQCIGFMLCVGHCFCGQFLHRTSHFVRVPFRRL